MINYDLIADIALTQIENSIAKVILISLASYSNAEGRCFPSQQTLSKDTALSERTIRTSLIWLSDNGYIRITRRPNKSSIYILTCMEEEMTKENGSAECADEVVSNITKLDISKGTNSNLTSAAKAAASKNSPFFIAFWQAYPRRIGKGAARTAFGRALAFADPNDIIQCAIKYAQHCEDMGTEKQYIPHPSTWLNAERWEDDLESEKKETKKVAGWLSEL